MSEMMLTRSEWKRRAGQGSVTHPLAVVPPLRKLVTTEVKLQEVDPQTGMQDVTFTLSTGALDRESDVINPEGWEVDAYLTNPVVLWAHQYQTPPIARATKVWVDGGKLLATDRFTPSDVNPFGAMIYRLVAGDFLKTVSVGFRPIEYVYNDDHHGYDFQRQELLEHSVVPVPANPEALIAAGETGIDLTPLREWAEKILETDDGADTAALWLPRETIEQVHAAAGRVAPTLIETSTADDAAEDRSPDDAESVADKLTDQEEVLMKAAIQALTEVIRELREEVKALPDAVQAKLPEPEPEPEPTAEAPTDPEPEPEPEPELEGGTEPEPEPDAAVTEDEARAIARGVIEQSILATTGALPD